MPDAPPLTPADRAIVEAAFVGMLRAGLGEPPEDFGAQIKWGMAMGRSALAAALPLVADWLRDEPRSIAVEHGNTVDLTSHDLLSRLAARLAEAGNE